MRSTTGYLDGTKLSPTEIANALCSKLGIITDVPDLIDVFKDRLPDYSDAHQDGSDLVFHNPVEDHTVRLSILMLREALRADQLYLFTESSIFVQ